MVTNFFKNRAVFNQYTIQNLSLAFISYMHISLTLNLLPPYPINPGNSPLQLENLLLQNQFLFF